MGSIYRKTEQVLEPATKQPVLDPETGKARRRQIGPYWIKFYRNGRPFRESTHSLDRAEARRKLKLREGEVAKGEFQGLIPDKVRYDELAKDLRLYYQTTKKRNLKEAEVRLKPLGSFFSGYRAKDIQPDVVLEYVQQRQAQEIADGTINRELEVLTKMLRLGHKHCKVARIPEIEKLKEAPPRSGFFERGDFQRVRKCLRPDLQLAITIAYTYGWRMQSEVLPLALSQVDLEAGTLRLAPGTTKNEDGRVVYLTSEIRTLIEEQLKRIEEELDNRTHCLFPHLTGEKRAGQQIKDFRKAWATACEEAGLVGMMRHDFRRSAVRNLINAGVPVSTAMMITGHRTREVFDRYSIVSPEDLKEATRKISAHPGNLGTIPGTISPVSLIHQS